MVGTNWDITEIKKSSEIVKEKLDELENINSNQKINFIKILGLFILEKIKQPK
jgi:hypothetical protein